MVGDEAEARSAGNKKKWPEMWSVLAVLRLGATLGSRCIDHSGAAQATGQCSGARQGRRKERLTGGPGVFKIKFKFQI
jgi:hypothetical protein